MFFPMIFFPPILEMLCSFIYILHSFYCVFFFLTSSGYLNTLCCHNYRQKWLSKTCCYSLPPLEGSLHCKNWMCGWNWLKVSVLLFFLPYMMRLRFRILNKNRTGRIHLSHVSSQRENPFWITLFTERAHLSLCPFCDGTMIEISVLFNSWTKDLVNIVIHFNNLHKEWQYILGCAKTCLLWDAPPSFPSGFAPVPCHRDIPYALHKYSQVKSPIQYNALNTFHNETFICYLHTHT